MSRVVISNKTSGALRAIQAARRSPSGVAVALAAWRNRHEWVDDAGRQCAPEFRTPHTAVDVLVNIVNNVCSGEIVQWRVEDSGVLVAMNTVSAGVIAGLGVLLASGEAYPAHSATEAIDFVNPGFQNSRSLCAIRTHDSLSSVQPHAGDAP